MSYTLEPNYANTLIKRDGRCVGYLTLDTERSEDGFALEYLLAHGDDLIRRMFDQLTANGLTESAEWAEACQYLDASK